MIAKRNPNVIIVIIYNQTEEFVQYTEKDVDDQIKYTKRKHNNIKKSIYRCGYAGECE